MAELGTETQQLLLSSQPASEVSFKRLQLSTPFEICASPLIDRLCPLVWRSGATTVTMLRSGASRSILRSLNIASNPAFKVTSSPVRQQLRSQLCTVSRRPQLVASVKPLAPQTLRWQSQGDRKPIDNVDPKREEKIAKGTLEPHPELVSTSSSVTPAIGMSRGEDASAGEHVGGGVMSDLVRSLVASPARILPLCCILIANHVANDSRDFQPCGSASTSILDGHGGCDSLRSHVHGYCRLCV